MELNRNTEVESLQVSPPDAKPVLYADSFFFSVNSLKNILIIFLCGGIYFL